MDAEDIIIIGAGAAGLIAARQLAKAGKHVTILEARRRTGGRIHTIRNSKFVEATEGGAEFIHGDLKVTIGLLKEYKIPFTPAEGKVIHVRDQVLEKDNDFVPEHHDLLEKKLQALKRDLPLKKFLDQHFKSGEYSSLRKSVIGFVEGYEAAEVERFSTFAFREDWLEAEEWKQYRIVHGYGVMINALVADCRALGCKLKLSSPVRSIRWKNEEVQVTCDHQKKFLANQVIVTVPLGVLQKNQIKFYPALPSKSTAFKALGFGHVIKILCLFSEKFWEHKVVKEKTGQDMKKLFFLFSEASVPTWWTQSPGNTPLLCGWLAGPKAKAWSTKSDRAIMGEALQSLAGIFQTDQKTIRANLVSWKVVNWSADEFAYGAYHYATVNQNKSLAVIARPEKRTIYFAGELFEEPAGTVEAALKSGLKVAELLLK